MEVIELRKKKTELEDQINKLIIEFIKDVGDCEISIHVGSTRITTTSGHEVFVGKSTTIDVTV